jgi:hypothetical protein
MQQIIFRMLESYEQGRLGRRQLIQGLAAIAAARHAAAASGSTFQGTALNHGKSQSEPPDVQIPWHSRWIERMGGSFVRKGCGCVAEAQAMLPEKGLAQA